MYVKTYIANFKKYRFLLWELVKKDIKLKYRRSYLGLIWTLLEPLLTMMVLYIVFSKLYGKSDKTFPFYILTGRLLYTYFSNATKGALTSISDNSGMIKKVYVPKYMYPLSSILSNYIIFLLSLIDLIPVGLLCHVYPTKHIVQIIAPLGLILLMAFGIGMFLATAQVFFRDIEYLWTVALMLIMYCSAIFYSPSRVVKTGYGWIFKLNPLYMVIENFRSCLLYHKRIDFTVFFTALAFSVVMTVLGTWLFYKKQDEFILHI